MSISVSDAQQIYNLLLEIDGLLKGVVVNTTKLNNDFPQTEKTLSSFRQLERVTIRYLAITQRMGLPDNMNSAISAIMRLVSVVRMAQISMNMLMMSNPATIAMGIAGIATTIISAADVMVGY